MTHDSSPSKRWRAWTFVAMVSAVALATCQGPQALHNWQAEKAYKERYAKAKALFEERCKTAGVVINRTVTDVEGIELTKVRQPVPWGGREYFDPMWTEAAMGGEVRGARCAHPQGRAPRGPSRHRQDAPLARGRGRGGCPLLQHFGFGLRRDVRRRRRQPCSRPIRPGKEERAVHCVRRRN